MWAWRKTRAPILVSFNCKQVNYQLAGLRQFDVGHEGEHIAGQRVQMLPYLIFAESSQRELLPVEGVFAFLDVRIGSTALAVEPNHPGWFDRQVGGDETYKSNGAPKCHSISVTARHSLSPDAA